MTGSVDGLLLVDKPSGPTSHDVVATVRRLAGTRRVGHAGTLDPMATGLLVLGVGRATRLLGHLALADKSYTATVRLGESTVTDDAQGEVVATVPVGPIDPGSLAAAVADLTGPIAQRPSAVSAVKVAGQRAYARVRAGETPDLPPRRVTVSRLDVVATRRCGDRLDVDVVVDCSTGTYIRALARDLGEALGVGGHLTALRRTRVGPYAVTDAATLQQLEAACETIPLSAAVAAAFPRRDVDATSARRLAHGGPLPSAGAQGGPVGVFGPGGELVALVEDDGGAARPLVVFAPA